MFDEDQGYCRKHDQAFKLLEGSDHDDWGCPTCLEEQYEQWAAEDKEREQQEDNA